MTRTALIAAATLAFAGPAVVPTPAAAIVKMKTCIDRTNHGRRVQVEALERTSCSMAKATYSKLTRSFTDTGWGWPRTLKVRMPGTHKTYG